MFLYAVVEGALAEFFEVRPQGQPALRSRIRNLQRLGLIPTAPKDGRRIAYSKYDIFDLALALSLAEFGVDPKKIVGSYMENFFRDADKIGTLRKHDWLCVYLPSYFSTGKSEITVSTYKVIKKVIESNPRAAIVNLADLVKRIEESLEL